MQRHERLSAVLDRLTAQGRLTVEDLVASFAVSPATARRDLDDLAGQQLVSRTRGGAVAHTVNYDLPLRYKSVRRAEQKRRIAAAAADLVDAGAVVGLNGGTTTSEVARSIASRSDLGVDLGPAAVTIVTNALNIAGELAVRRHIRLVVIGGVVRPHSYELTGPFAQAVLDGLTLDVLFLGVDALSVADGAAARHEGEAAINQTMVRRSRRVVAVADSSKLDRRAFCGVCAVKAIDVLITDTGVAPATLAAFCAAGVDVHVV